MATQEKTMKIDIIERFEIEGRGTVFAAKIEDYKDENLIGRKLSHKGEIFLIRDVEISRGGIISTPKSKRIFGLLVKKVEE